MVGLRVVGFGRVMYDGKATKLWIGRVTGCRSKAKTSPWLKSVVVTCPIMKALNFLELTLLIIVVGVGWNCCIQKDAACENIYILRTDELLGNEWRRHTAVSITRSHPMLIRCSFGFRLTVIQRK